MYIQEVINQGAEYIRRKTWLPMNYIKVSKNLYEMDLDYESIMATDWEIYNMPDYETVKSKEEILLVTEIRGYRCEVVKVEDEILLYVDGYFEGELYEEETAEGYISQIKGVLA